MEHSLSSHAGLSGTALKRMACVSMLADHIGASCLEGGPLAAWEGNVFLPIADPALQRLAWLDIALRSIGRLAFPLYCFLLVEGFCHTHSVKSYAFRLFVFALISEVPFDLAFFQSPLYYAYQNVFFTLFLGVCCLLLLRRWENPGARYRALRIFAILACGFLAEALQTDYGFVGVALIAALYLLRQNRSMQALAGCVLTCWELPAPLAFVPLYFYNGKRGACPRWEQLAFYAFYPVHLSVLAVVTLLCLHAG